MIEKTDFLVIGSGIAGLSFALHAAQYGEVAVITKKQDTDSNTNYAQGGIACVLDPHDSFTSHIQDTLSTGRGLSDSEAVNILVEEGPRGVKELLNWGVQFTTSERSHAFAHLDLGREGGHSSRRIVHARDLTGKVLEESLIEKIRSTPSIRVYENYCLVELITTHHVPDAGPQNACFGAYVLDTISGQIHIFKSRITHLSTGGAGQVYLHTTNPSIATGDGLACAYRSGARLANMEFIQFHPTTLYHPEANSFLISEALRGYGAVLKDRRGNEFMDRYHPMKSLAPRDIVARAIDKEMKHTGESCVYLDIRHASAEKTRKQFPNIYARCRELGIDITKDLIPVVPAAHYICGGIQVDVNGNTDIPYLYACGEVAHTGVHGANRLASNSLLEAVVFSRRAAEDAARKLCSVPRIGAERIPLWDDSGTVATEEWILLSHNVHEIRTIMWDYVGIVRSTLRLQRARRRLALLERETENFYRRTKITRKLLELRNLVMVAKLIVISALRRKESRGLHFTTDYPEQDDRHWNRNTILTKSNKL
ncbi:MAG: L-aspartate oxidase [Chitinivibrionales bacterium]